MLQSDHEFTLSQCLELWHANLCVEIYAYHKLKEEWGLGRLKCRLVKCQHGYGCPRTNPYLNERYYFYIYGYYEDVENNNEECVFLGYNYLHAMRPIKTVKSSLGLLPQQESEYAKKIQMKKMWIRAIKSLTSSNGEVNMQKIRGQKS